MSQNPEAFLSSTSELLKSDHGDDGSTLLIRPFEGSSENSHYIVSDVMSDAENDDDDDDFEDETLMERLIGLTEMFPETFRNVTWSIACNSVKFAKHFYEFSRSAVWIAATSAIILAAPTVIEKEITQIEELNRQQQRQILLGPSATGAPNLMPPMMPPQPMK